MRIALVTMALAGPLALSGCSNFLNPGGAAAARWAEVEKTRAAKIAGLTDADKVCKVMPVTGSTMPKKVCSTQAEWETIEKQQREASDRMNADIRNNTGNVGNTGS